MNAKERIHAVMDGAPVDRMPVHASYSQLYHMDHFDELTGLPRHYYTKWLYSGTDEFIELFRTIHSAAPFDIIQPPGRPSEAVRRNIEFVELDGKPYLRHKRENRLDPIQVKSKSGHAGDDYRANESQRVFDTRDVDERVKVTPAERQIADGAAEGYRAVVDAFGADSFILTGGVVGTIYGCGQWLGQTNLFVSLVENPGLVDHLCKRITEQNIETIRTLAHAGGDAIYIDDATATSDMISVPMYERFSLPYMKQLVDEIKRLGHRAIIIYFGGIEDRLDQIAEIGADLLNMEARMKGYRNDLAFIAERIGEKISLCTNLNPYEHIERLSTGDLRRVMHDYAKAGLNARGIITYSASPITMKTPLSRVREFIDIGRTLPVPRPLHNR